MSRDQLLKKYTQFYATQKKLQPPQRRAFKKGLKRYIKTLNHTEKGKFYDLLRKELGLSTTS